MNILTLRATGGRQVTVHRDLVEFGYHRTILPAFVVATTTGYRATLPECRRDDCEAGTVEPCALPYGHTKSAKGANGCDGSNGTSNGRCHEWHEPSVRRFAEDVLATFAYKLPAVPKGVAGPGVPRSKYRPEAWTTT